MLINIIDDRRDRAAWRVVRASIVPADGDYAQADTAFLFTPDQRTLSVAAAVQWAQRLPFGVELYLTDAEGQEGAR